MKTKRWLIQVVFNTDAGETSSPFVRSADSAQEAMEKVANEYRNKETAFGQFLECRSAREIPVTG